jgi:predicted small metal-binding protein
MKKYVLACKDLDSANAECTYVARANTSHEVLARVLEHARDSHPEQIKGMSAEEVLAFMRTKIHEEE